MQCDGTTVVARAMVLLECAMFVRSLCAQTLNPPCTIWVQHNLDSPCMHNVSSNLRKWAEAIGEKLRLSELKEREMYVKLQSKGEEVLPEEPVFPDEYEKKWSSRGGEGSTVGLSTSYALKMAACNLLLEITRFLRDIPPHFAPSAPVSQVGTPLITHSMERIRKISNVSAASLEDTSSSHLTLNPRNQEFRLPRFGSSLSIDDTENSELTKTLSTEESFSSTNPRRKRTSIYLHISSNQSTTGSLTRSTSIKRQSRMVRVSDSPDVKTLTRSGLTSSPSIKNRRKSISSGYVRHRRPSLFVNAPPSQPSNHPAMTVGSYHPVRTRRKSVGALLYQNSFQESDIPPATPTTPHPLHLIPSPTKTSNTSLGSSLNIGFTKLRRSAQKAFRRHGTKKSSSDATSPGSSPALTQRKKARKPSISDSYSQRSVFYSTMPDDGLKYYQWLEVVEHMILIESTSSKESLAQRRKACLELTTALKKVYSNTYQEEEAESEETRKRGSPSGRGGSRKTIRHSSSLGSIFIHRLTLNDTATLQAVTERGVATTPTYNRVTSLPVVQRKSAVQWAANQDGTTRSISVQYTPHGSVADTRARSTLAKLSFSDFNYSKFLHSSLGGRALFSLEGVDSEDTIQLTIEAESPFEMDYLTAQSDKERCKYIDYEYAGLIHLPFSTLIRAGPILHTRTFSVLKGLAWDCLLSSDKDLAQAAGAFFLLACAKESEKSLKGFVANKVLNQQSSVQCEAILRFQVLWNCRYGVWPRMEERAQKKLNLNDKEDKEVRT